MQYSFFDSIGEKVSKLGFGLMRLPRIAEDSDIIDRDEAMRLIDLAIKSGVNYFDTAYFYHGGDSEQFVKEALSKYPRESFLLATKLPGSHIRDTGETPQYLFEGQLEKCGVDYFDFYLLHAVSRDIYPTFEKYGAYEYLSEEKKKGRIKHLGFSYHGDLEFFKELVDKHPWDFVQLQINYYDWENQNAKEYYEFLESRGIPCIVMEPVRGGSLHTLNDDARKVFEKLGDSTPASYALRYVAQLPNVLTTLSGMSTYEQTVDNINTFNECKPLSPEEEKAVQEANILFRNNFAIPCTDCKYCVDACVQNVNIPLCFKAYNEYNKTRSREVFAEAYSLVEDTRRAELCIECGACTTHCPQQIKIPEMLKKVINMGE